MQCNNFSKYMAVMLFSAGLWFGSSLVMPEVVMADNQESVEVNENEDSEPESTQIEYEDYTVKSGDYLEAIAIEHDVHWPSIYEHNDEIIDPDLIYPNQQLEIPTSDIPLTRSLSGSVKIVPEEYAPAPTEPVRQVPEALTSFTPEPAGYTTFQSPPEPTSAAAGVVGLNQVIGRPYVYGGTTLAGFDCSGLTQYLAGLRGIQLPRTVADQYHATSRIGQADLQPGDLVFFNWNHVGMYIGGGQIVHATNPAQGVRVDSLSTAIQYNGYLGAGRL